MSRIVNFTVDNRQYELIKMPPNGGHRFATKVASLLGLSLAGEAGSIMSLAQEAGIQAGADMATAIAAPGMDAKILKLIMRLVPHIDADKLSDIIDDVYRMSKVQVRVGNGPSMDLSPNKDFDEYFGSDEGAGDFYPVSFWAIKENCGAFFVRGGPGWSILARQFQGSVSPTTVTTTTSSAALQRPSVAASKS